MADEIEEKYGTRPELIKGRGGVFEVMVGDELIYSKKETGRFPEPGEVEGSLEGKLTA